MSSTRRLGTTGLQPSRLHLAIQGILLASALTVSGPVHAESINDHAGIKRSYHIGGGSLSQALRQFATSSGLLFSAEATLTDGKTTNGLEGEYTVEEGFRKLLAGSGLTYSFTGEDSVAIKPVDSGSNAASTMPAVTVLGKADYDSTDPYNPYYSLPIASSATKTDTPIMETPYSIQVVPKQVLEDIQGIRPNDALDYVSGVYRSGGSGEFLESSNRRGFDNYPQGDYRDGMPYPVANYVIGGRDLASTERVEVLKGPASLLYGLTNPGGMVNYVTKKPLSNPYYSLQQQFGSFDLYRTTVDATGPINDDKSLLYRFNLAYKSANSFRDFVNSERTFLAPVITWNISPKTQVNFEMEYDTGHVVYDRGIPAIGDRPANLPRERFTSNPYPYKYERTMLGVNWSHAFNENWKLSHRFNAQWIGQNGVASDTDGIVSANGTMDRFGLLQYQNPGQQPIYYNSVNLTGNFKTFGFGHTLLLGGDHYRTSISTTQAFIVDSINIFDPQYPDLASARGNPTDYIKYSAIQDWFGLYLQDQIKLPYNVQILGGFRYDSTESSSNSNGSESHKPRQDSLVPRGGIVWQPIPEFSVYGSYTENFSGVNGTGFGGKFLDPAGAQQWELGLKTELFDKKFLATLAWFDLTKQNVAVSDPLHPGFSIAIGEARSAGLELDLKGEILPGWNLIGAYAYTPDASVTVGSAGQLGRRFQGVPLHGGSIFTTYELQSGVLQGLKFGGGVIARGARNTNNDSSTAILPGYATVNLLSSYGWNVGKSHLTAQLNVNNLLDKTYYPASQDRSDIEVGMPRNFMGSIRVEY